MKRWICVLSLVCVSCSSRATGEPVSAAPTSEDPEASSATADAEAPEPEPPTPDELMGSWTVTLFHSPTEPPSETTLVIDAVSEGVLTGRFNDSPLTEARAIVHEDEVLFTATTEDGNGLKIHSGELEEGEIEGQTLSTAEKSLVAWKASRSER